MSVYSLVDGEYGKPAIHELKGRTSVGILPGAAIEWDEPVERLPAVGF